MSNGPIRWLASLAPPPSPKSSAQLPVAILPEAQSAGTGQTARDYRRAFPMDACCGIGSGWLQGGMRGAPESIGIRGARAPTRRSAIMRKAWSEDAFGFGEQIFRFRRGQMCAEGHAHDPDYLRRDVSESPRGARTPMDSLPGRDAGGITPLALLRCRSAATPIIGAGVRHLRQSPDFKSRDKAWAGNRASANRVLVPLSC